MDYWKSLLVIFMLSRFSSSKEVRERKRRLLERDYTETEEVLNVYLSGELYFEVFFVYYVPKNWDDFKSVEKYNEVTQILNVYRDVSEHLGSMFGIFAVFVKF